MPGSRKVRVFRDRKKSPNWYVEWRDAQGQRRSESCGPDRIDAERRAQQIQQQMREARVDAATRAFTGFSEPSSKTAPGVATNVLRLRARIDWKKCEVPIEISVELSPELLRVLREEICPGSGG